MSTTIAAWSYANVNGNCVLLRWRRHEAGTSHGEVSRRDDGRDRLAVPSLCPYTVRLRDFVHHSILRYIFIVAFEQNISVHIQRIWNYVCLQKLLLWPYEFCWTGKMRVKHCVIFPLCRHCYDLILKLNINYEDNVIFCVEWLLYVHIIIENCSELFMISLIALQNSCNKEVIVAPAAKRYS